MNRGRILSPFLLFSILINLISCLEKRNNQVAPNTNKTEKAIANYLIEKELDSLKFLVVIPNGGCVGCIDNSIRYLSANLQRIDSIHVIFTQTKEKKLLKVQFGTTNYYNKKVFIDSADSEIARAFDSYFPMVYLIEKYDIIGSTAFDETLFKGDIEKTGP